MTQANRAANKLPVIIATWPFGLPASEMAWKALEGGATPLDAVIAGVSHCEDDSSVDSVGYGGLPDASGEVTLDASVVDEKGRCGAVACLRRIRHAAQVARAVMDRTPHLLLVGEAATAFAISQGFQKSNLLSPEAAQYRTFEVIRALFARLAEQGPIVAAFEDLHWADATSLQLLENLLADTEVSALLLVLTLRPERDHAAWRLKEAASRELSHRTRELGLEALSGDGGRELLRSLIGGTELAPAMERRILEPAEGNPFFLEEIVRSLVDAGALVHDRDGWRFDHEVDVEVPPTVEKVIVARIDRLGSDARNALLAAAVLGRSFGLPHLAAVAAQ